MLYSMLPRPSTSPAAVHF